MEDPHFEYPPPPHISPLDLSVEGAVWLWHSRRHGTVPLFLAEPLTRFHRVGVPVVCFVVPMPPVVLGAGMVGRGPGRVWRDGRRDVRRNVTAPSVPFRARSNGGGLSKSLPNERHPGGSC